MTALPNQDAPRIAVIIPFFQREPGVLARALRSVAAQDYAGPCRVIVVDDASPVAADAEAQDIELPASMTLQLIRQPNRGPGGARNRGLDELAGAADYVAFLDSDDEWVPDHLSRAVKALEQGHDFYFTDIYQLDQQVSAFKRGGKVDLAKYRPLPAIEDGYEYAGDMVEQIVFGNLIGTSSVVFRLKPLAAVRFRTELRRAGEDYLFWIGCARAGARFCFSSRVEVRYGRGVNIFAGTQWGTPEHLQRTVDELAYRRIVLAEMKTSSPSHQKLQGRIDALLSDYGASFWSAMLRQPASTLSALLAHRRQQPGLLAALPRRFFRR